MDTPPDLNQLSEQQVRKLAEQLLNQSRQQAEVIARIEQENIHYQAETDRYQRENQRIQLQNEQYKHELAILKRHRFANKSEVLDKYQRGLLDDLVEEDLAGIEEEIERQAPIAPRAEPKSQPKRKPLPPELPRTVIKHEPDSTVCACGCQMTHSSEDISEKLDYIPGTFTVEQHVRGKWACISCETLTQALVRPKSSTRACRRLDCWRRCWLSM